MNCPFYGYAFYSGAGTRANPPFILFPQNGNQCALATDAHAPCQMEMHHETPDWKACILVKAARCEDV